MDSSYPGLSGEPEHHFDFCCRLIFGYGVLSIFRRCICYQGVFTAKRARTVCSPSAAACTRYKINFLLFLSPAVFSERILPPNLLFGIMIDWKEMAELVGRKLVENGQERILQRIFDGVTSDLILDVSDYKESQEHRLLHLVWRKFPRNRRTTDEQKTNVPNSTQTDEFSTPDQLQISKKILHS